MTSRKSLRYSIKFNFFYCYYHISRLQHSATNTEQQTKELIFCYLNPLINGTRFINLWHIQHILLKMYMQLMQKIYILY